MIHRISHLFLFIFLITLIIDKVNASGIFGLFLKFDPFNSSKGKENLMLYVEEVFKDGVDTSRFTSSDPQMVEYLNKVLGYIFPKDIIDIVNDYQFSEDYIELYHRVVSALFLNESERKSLKFYEKSFVPNLVTTWLCKLKYSSALSMTFALDFSRLVFKHLLYQSQQLEKDEFIELLEKVFNAFTKLPIRFRSDFPSQYEFYHLNSFNGRQKFSSKFWNFIICEFMEANDDLFQAFDLIIKDFYHGSGSSTKLNEYERNPLNSKVNIILLKLMIYKYDKNGELKKCLDDPTIQVVNPFIEKYKIESIRHEIFKDHEFPILSEKILKFYKKNKFYFSIGNFERFYLLIDNFMNLTAVKNIKEYFDLSKHEDLDTFKEYIRVYNMAKKRKALVSGVPGAGLYR